MILLLPWIPFLGALLSVFTPKENVSRLKTITLVCSAICFAMTLALVFQFNPNATGYQFEYQLSWLPALGISYHVGLDGINMTLCLLHALVSLAGAFAACWPKERLKEYLVLYLILVGAIYGVFTSLDIFMLYLFYETTLIPLYPMIGIWGSKNKEYGAMKLTIFITTGAVLSLFGIMLLYKATGGTTFDLPGLQHLLRETPLDLAFQKYAAALFIIGFGVIASLWPLHSWSPIGYASAPTAVSMLHAGVLKKMGPYLILRLAVGLLPQGTQHWGQILSILAGIGIIYAGYAAITQKDLKYIIGFSSVSHMGYILLGIAAMTPTALSGVVLLMFSHGVMAAATFALIGFMYEQTHERSVEAYGGLSRRTPFWAICFIMASMASLGLPGFSNFVSELLVCIGSWQKFPVVTGFAVFGILITALYLLRTVQSVCYGPVSSNHPGLRDVSTLAEKFPFVLLLGALMLFGFWPQGLLRMIQPAIGALLS